ncbi:unnamed protein product [Chrysoparadoxa australica]
MDEEERGRLLVGLGEVKLHLSEPIPEEEISSSSLNAVCTVQGPAAPFFSAPSETDKSADSVSFQAKAKLQQGDEPDQVTATLDLRIDSTLELVDLRLSALANSCLSIQLNLTKSAGEEISCGAVEVKLDQLMQGDNQLDLSMPLGSMPEPAADEEVPPSEGLLASYGSTSSISLRMTTNDALADYTIGAGLLKVPSVIVESLPPSWEVNPPPETKPKEWNDAVAGLLANPMHEYSLTITQPPVTADEGEISANLQLEIPGLSISGPGTLRYTPQEVASIAEDGSVSPSVTPSVSDSVDGGDNSSKAEARPSGTWSLEFSPASTCFLHRDAIKHLRAEISSGSQLPLQLVRTPMGNTDGDPKVPS